MVPIVLWSTVLAFTRGLGESLGIFRAGTFILLVGGSLSCAILFFSYGFLTPFRTHKPLYWFVCGTLFISYQALLYIAIGTCDNRSQLIEVGLINYLWIGFTLLFSVPILKKKAKPFLLIFGILLGFSGAMLAILSRSTAEFFSTSAVFENIAGNPIPYLASFVASVAWGLYSNYNISLSCGKSSISVAPIFILFSGILMALISLSVSEEAQWSLKTCLELAYASIFPSAVSYTLWDIGMRKGNSTLIASVSYIIPLASTVFISIFLGVPLSSKIWLACASVIAGAAICLFSISEPLPSLREK